MSNFLFQRQDWMRSPLLKALTCPGYPQGLPASFASDRLIPQAQVQLLTHLCLACTWEKGPTTRCSVIGICAVLHWGYDQKNFFSKRRWHWAFLFNTNHCMLKANYVDVKVQNLTSYWVIWSLSYVCKNWTLKISFKPFKLRVFFKWNNTGTLKSKICIKEVSTTITVEDVFISHPPMILHQQLQRQLAQWNTFGRGDLTT